MMDCPGSTILRRYCALQRDGQICWGCLGIGSWRMRLAGPSRRRRRGVGLGLHRYVLRDRRLWMGNTASVAVIASHQDQVTALPPGAAVIGAGDFTRNAMIDHRDGGYRFNATLNSPPASRAT